MGVKGLLQLLDPIASPVTLEDLNGKTVVIDMYSWLHKGAYSCSKELSLEQYTRKHVNYCLNRLIQLVNNNIKPIVVFDGDILPMKILEEERRRSRREYELHLATSLEKDNPKQAAKHFARAVDIRPEDAHMLIKAIENTKELSSIECIVAPYEADAQISHIVNSGRAYCAISEDSDLLVYRCDKVVYKLDLKGNGFMFSVQDILSCQIQGKTPFANAQYNLPQLAVLSGCDYIPSLPGVGLLTALKALESTGSFPAAVAMLIAKCDVMALQGRASDYGFKEGDSEEERINGYSQALQRALLVYQYQTIWLPQERLGYVTPLPSPPALMSQVSLCGVRASNIGEAIIAIQQYVGPWKSADVIKKSCQGLINPITLNEFSLTSPPHTSNSKKSFQTKPLQTPKTIGEKYPFLMKSTPHKATQETSIHNPNHDISYRNLTIKKNDIETPQSYFNESQLPRNYVRTEQNKVSVMNQHTNMTNRLSDVDRDKRYGGVKIGLTMSSSSIQNDHYSKEKINKSSHKNNVKPQYTKQLHNIRPSSADGRLSRLNQTILPYNMYNQVAKPSLNNYYHDYYGLLDDEYYENCQESWFNKVFRDNSDSMNEKSLRKRRSLLYLSKYHTYIHDHEKKLNDIAISSKQKQNQKQLEFSKCDFTSLLNNDYNPKDLSLSIRATLTRVSWMRPEEQVIEHHFKEFDHHVEKLHYKIIHEINSEKGENTMTTQQLTQIKPSYRKKKITLIEPRLKQDFSTGKEVSTYTKQIHISKQPYEDSGKCKTILDVKNMLKTNNPYLIPPQNQESTNFINDNSNPFDGSFYNQLHFDRGKDKTRTNLTKNDYATKQSILDINNADSLHKQAHMMSKRILAHTKATELKQLEQPIIQLRSEAFKSKYNQNNHNKTDDFPKYGNDSRYSDKNQTNNLRVKTKDYNNHNTDIRHNGGQDMGHRIYQNDNYNRFEPTSIYEKNYSHSYLKSDCQFQSKNKREREIGFNKEKSTFSPIEPLRSPFEETRSLHHTSEACDPNWSNTVENHIQIQPFNDWQKDYNNDKYSTGLDYSNDKYQNPCFKENKLYSDFRTNFVNESKFDYDPCVGVGSNNDFDTIPFGYGDDNIDRFLFQDNYSIHNMSFLPVNCSLSNLTDHSSKLHFLEKPFLYDEVIEKNVHLFVKEKDHDMKPCLNDFQYFDQFHQSEDNTPINLFNSRKNGFAFNSLEKEHYSIREPYYVPQKGLYDFEINENTQSYTPRGNNSYNDTNDRFLINHSAFPNSSSRYTSKKEQFPTQSPYNQRNHHLTGDRMNNLKHIIKTPLNTSILNCGSDHVFNNTPGNHYSTPCLYTTPQSYTPNSSCHLLTVSNKKNSDYFVPMLPVYSPMSYTKTPIPKQSNINNDSNIDNSFQFSPTFKTPKTWVSKNSNSSTYRNQIDFPHTFEPLNSPPHNTPKHSSKKRKLSYYHN